jgi:hypothetical protein
MIDTIRRYCKRPLDERLIPLALLAAVGLAYGLLFNQLGLYWDDFPLTWTAHTYGLAGLARYFSTNRPFWGLLYQLSNAVLGEQTWQWQLFALFWRWLSAVLFWLTVRELWPRPRSAALLAGLALALYPGFGQQAIAMVYGHFFWVLSAYFLSLYAHLRALRSAQRAWAWHVLALAAALFNLLTMEYFFLLELARPLMLGLLRAREYQTRKAWLLRVLRDWAPYLLLFLGVGIWRAFFFTYQTNNYQPLGLQGLLADPLRGLWSLIQSAGLDVLLAGLAAWGLPFTFANLDGAGLTTLALYLGVTLAVLAFSALTLFKQAGRAAEDDSAPRRAGLEMLLAGLILLVIAGGPFYLTGLPVRLHFPNDRFTIPFIPGSALLLSGLLHWIFPRRVFWRSVLAALLLGLAAGSLFANANAYRRDWLAQRAFFWQLSWRIPGLQEGTTLLTNDLPLNFYSDNSLTAPLNWIYAPENTSQSMAVALLYPTVRTGKDALPAFKPGVEISIDYLVASFNGSTDQTVAVYYQPPGCLRVLDGEVEANNLFVPAQIREAATDLGSTEWIEANPDHPAVPPAQYYGSEPAHGWCYYYEKADLARQQQDWDAVAQLADQAFALGDYPNDPAERLPFIEGYAHAGRWDEALAQSRQAAQISPAMQPVLCKLWQRIAANTTAGTDQQTTLNTAYSELGCTP